MLGKGLLRYGYRKADTVVLDRDFKTRNSIISLFPNNTAQTLVEEHPGQIACLILEAETVEPPDNFLHEVQRLAKKWCPPHPRCYGESVS